MAAAGGRRGFSYDDAGTLRGLFLKLLKRATPFQYCNLQLPRHNPNKQRPCEVGGGAGGVGGEGLFPLMPLAPQ